MYPYEPICARPREQHYIHVITALRNLELTVMLTLNVKVIDVHNNNSNSVLFPDIIRVSINIKGVPASKRERHCQLAQSIVMSAQTLFLIEMNKINRTAYIPKQLIISLTRNLRVAALICIPGTTGASS